MGMGYLKDHYWKRWLKKHQCKLAGGLSQLHKNTELVIEASAQIGHVPIGAHVREIGAHSYIRSEGELALVSSIGRFCSFGVGVVVGQEKNNHPIVWLSTHPFQYTDTAHEYHAKMDMAVIGHDVWIGHGAMILEGVQVGTGAVIATRAMVTSDVPPYAIVAGFPAKILRYRHSPEIIERLLASRWWELEVETLLTLPLNDPEASLDKMAAMGALPKASYQKIGLNRQGCRLL
jgi:chloramphenicol O-acetyltransferase type B